MIINTGQRTDIPAFYPEWFANRLRAGYVCVRNPYNPQQVSRYRLDPGVVDVIGFCTKNPKPFFPYLSLPLNFKLISHSPYRADAVTFFTHLLAELLYMRINRSCISEIIIIPDIIKNLFS